MLYNNKSRNLLSSHHRSCSTTTTTTSSSLSVVVLVLVIAVFNSVFINAFLLVTDVASYKQYSIKYGIKTLTEQQQIPLVVLLAAADRRGNNSIGRTNNNDNGKTSNNNNVDRHVGKFNANTEKENNNNCKKQNRIVIVGGGIGGLSAAFDARHLLSKDDSNKIIVVSDQPNFSFVPSNPWIAVGKRQPTDIQLPLADILPKYNIEFICGKATKLQPQSNKLYIDNGTVVVEYDYLVIATGPYLAFDEIPGLKQHGVSICTTKHAMHAKEVLDQLMNEPGPVIVGATQSASCFGPAYEYALLLQHTLYKRGGKQLVNACPITFVTPEPYIGHLGLRGAGESEKILTKLFEQKHIKSITNAVIRNVGEKSVFIEQMSSDISDTHPVAQYSLPSKLTMLIPPFRGHKVWRDVIGLTDTDGMVLTNQHQQSIKYSNIFSVGVCAGIPSLEQTPVPVGMPKTGYMIESQGSATIQNIQHMIHNNNNNNKLQPLHTTPTLNGLCITDFGDDGAIFLTIPQIPPRKHDYTIHGKIATLAKIAFEKYFLHKIESGDTDPYYEKYMLKLIGVDRVKDD